MAEQHSKSKTYHTKIDTSTDSEQLRLLFGLPAASAPPRQRQQHSSGRTKYQKRQKLKRYAKRKVKHGKNLSNHVGLTPLLSSSAARHLLEDGWSNSSNITTAVSSSLKSVVAAKQETFTAKAAQVCQCLTLSNES